MLRASWGIRRMQEYHLCEQLSLLRLTTAAICGSDLHMYEGRAPLEPGTIFGHENLGVIEEVGAAVKTIRRGDRVVLPFNIACGFCFNCARQFPNACLTTDPQGHSALKLPGTPGDEFEHDFVLLADVFRPASMQRSRPGCAAAIRLRFGARGRWDRWPRSAPAFAEPRKPTSWTARRQSDGAHRRLLSGRSAWGRRREAR